MLFGIDLIMVKIYQQLEQSEVIFFPYLEFWTNVGFACFFKEVKAFVELDNVALNIFLTLNTLRPSDTSLKEGFRAVRHSPCRFQCGGFRV